MDTDVYCLMVSDRIVSCLRNKISRPPVFRLFPESPDFSSTVVPTQRRLTGSLLLAKKKKRKRSKTSIGCKEPRTGEGGRSLNVCRPTQGKCDIPGTWTEGENDSREHLCKWRKSSRVELWSTNRWN